MCMVKIAYWIVVSGLISSCVLSIKKICNRALDNFEKENYEA